MPITYHKEDILAHVDTTEKTVSAQATSISGCITLLSISVASLQVCYSISGNQIKVTATLKTPLGDADIGSVVLDPNNPKATIRGGIDRFKAEVTLTFDFSALRLEICGKACAPLAGCASGCTTVHV